DLKWDVEELAVSQDGSRLAFAVNQEGASSLYLLDAASGARQAVALPRNAVIGSMRFPRGRNDLLALSLQTATEPSDVYQADLKSGKLVRWTRSEVGGLDRS